MSLFIKSSKIFNWLIYSTLICEVFLFLVLGIQLITERAKSTGGGGDVIALFYTGPMIIINLIIIPFFLMLSINRMTNKSINHSLLKKMYQKNTMLFIIEIAFALFANIIIFI